MKIGKKKKKIETAAKKTFFLSNQSCTNNDHLRLFSLFLLYLPNFSYLPGHTTITYKKKKRINWFRDDLIPKVK